MQKRPKAGSELTLAREADLDSRVAGITAAHRKPRSKRPEFDSDKDRSEYIVEREVEILVPLLPIPVRMHVLGGPKGMSQVPGVKQQTAYISRTLTARAGTDGKKVADTRLALRVIRLYGLEVLGHMNETERDEALFPVGGMSATLVHELIHREDARAKYEAKGKKGGVSIGPRFRDTLIFMAEKLLWPMDADRATIYSAAPKATGGSTAGTDKAGTFPLAVKIHLERIARYGAPDLSPLANKACTFYCRTLLVANFDQSVRVGESIRVELMPDEEDPDWVIRGTAWMGKDGAPMNLYAPAEGILGPYEWYRDHLKEVIDNGQVYPLWTKTRRSGGRISLAGPLKWNIAGKSDVRDALHDILRLAPLSYSEEEIAHWSLRGHSMHATFPDWARAIGTNPRYAALLPEPLRKGFDESDVGALGLWLRDEGAKQEATAQQAAMEAQGRPARQAAAQAMLRGRPAVRADMKIYYGLAGISGSRYSERFLQLRVRQRLAHVLRWLVSAAGGPERLPRGPADIGILQSVD